MIGANLGGLFHALFPTLVHFGATSAFSIFGRMRLFGGISKAPLAVLVTAVDTTGNHAILGPGRVSIAIAYVATSKNLTYRAQVSTRRERPAHRMGCWEYFHGLVGFCSIIGR